MILIMLTCAYLLFRMLVYHYVVLCWRNNLAVMLMLQNAALYGYFFGLRSMTPTDSVPCGEEELESEPSSDTL